jgi:hypothetical protein
MNACDRCGMELPDTCAHCGAERSTWAEPDRQSKYCTAKHANSARKKRQYQRNKARG